MTALQKGSAHVVLLLGLSRELVALPDPSRALPYVWRGDHRKPRTRERRRRHAVLSLARAAAGEHDGCFGYADREQQRCAA